MFIFIKKIFYIGFLFVSSLVIKDIKFSYNVIKDLNVKVLNLMARTNEIRHIK